MAGSQAEREGRSPWLQRVAWLCEPGESAAEGAGPSKQPNGPALLVAEGLRGCTGVMPGLPGASEPRGWAVTGQHIHQMGASTEAEPPA